MRELRATLAMLPRRRHGTSQSCRCRPRMAGTNPGEPLHYAEAHQRPRVAHEPEKNSWRAGVVGVTVLHEDRNRHPSRQTQGG